ncbi:DUF3307 domain-containing protein [Shewanella sp. GXUN23E]|uniref:DUF3307 domain-containing protein n=1 Tax=Shewanella sp. GXUN23E TaxID=3422498 RepID=UPI003D7C438C
MAVQQEMLLAALVMGHVVGDFYIQGETWVSQRRRLVHRTLLLGIHAALHGILFAIISLLFAIPWDIVLLGGVTVVISHYCFDLAQSYFARLQRWFILDQLLHLLVILLLWQAMTNPELDALKPAQYLCADQLVVILAYLLVLTPVSVITSRALTQWQPDMRSGDNSLARAGKAIGMLERFLILTFVLLDQFAGIGFLMAAKSIFRFGDLRESRDHKMTEYVMMGTLLSFTLALLIGLATKWLLT